MSGDPKMSAKILLRKQLNLILKNLSQEEIRRQSNVIAERVLRNDEFKNAKVVALYLSMENEVQTDKLLKEVFNQHKICFIPRFSPLQPEMDMIKLTSLNEYYNLVPNNWNIKQHSDQDIIESVFDRGELDLVIVPGLGFTKDGKRLGRGKGYYDKFFAKCQKELKNFPFTIGLALNEQIVTDIPVADHDFLVDTVVYPD